MSVAEARIIDLNHNGMSDIWEWIFDAYGVNPNADPDGDGYSNFQESIAATDPFNSNSAPPALVMDLAETNFSVTIPCALGKQYQLQGTTAIGQSNWVVEATLVARSGTNITLTAPINANAKFYRIAISDVDSDGDGVTDWEEYQLGLDPFNPTQQRSADVNGNPLSDYAYVTNLLASENVITIAATTAAPTQPNPGQTSTLTGQFTVTRGGFPLNSITVNLGLGGPGVGFGTPGLDYVPLPASVSLAAGVSSQTINLTPMADTNLAAPVLAQLQLLAGRELFGWDRKQCQRRYLSFAHRQWQRAARPVLYQFKHDLHEQQEFQPHQSHSDAD